MDAVVMQGRFSDGCGLICAVIYALIILLRLFVSSGYCDGMQRVWDGQGKAVPLNAVCVRACACVRARVI